MSETTALGLSARTGGVMVAFTVMFTAVMAFTYDATREQIEASATEEKMKLISEVLPATATTTPAPRLCQARPHPRAGPRRRRPCLPRPQGRPARRPALRSHRPDGYSGRIELIIASRADGGVSGVRAVSHRETPGLGDYIDPRKDKTRSRPGSPSSPTSRPPTYPAAS
jgi:electron transport complex protein RnfG